MVKLHVAIVVLMFLCAVEGGARRGTTTINCTVHCITESCYAHNNVVGCANTIHHHHGDALRKTIKAYKAFKASADAFITGKW